MENTFIRNCAWGYRCDKKWESLDITDNDDVRFCNGCQREVHNTHSSDELVKNISLNRCVNFSSLMLDMESGIEEESEQLLGYPADFRTDERAFFADDEDIPF
jgi:hypothetical protein